MVPFHRYTAQPIYQSPAVYLNKLSSAHCGEVWSQFMGQTSLVGSAEPEYMLLCLADEREIPFAAPIGALLSSSLGTLSAESQVPWNLESAYEFQLIGPAPAEGAAGDESVREQAEPGGGRGVGQRHAQDTGGHQNRHPLRRFPRLPVGSGVSLFCFRFLSPALNTWLVEICHANDSAVKATPQSFTSPCHLDYFLFLVIVIPRRPDPHSTTRMKP